jgi:hypothetical protein
MVERPGLAAFHRPGETVESDAVQIFAQDLVALRLGHEQEVGTGVEHLLAARLMREQVVAEIDRSQPRQPGAMVRQPACRRRSLAVLLVVAVCGTRNSDGSGSTRLCPGPTMLTPSMR